MIKKYEKYLCTVDDVHAYVWWCFLVCFVGGGGGEGTLLNVWQSFYNIDSKV